MMYSPDKKGALMRCNTKVIRMLLAGAYGMLCLPASAQPDNLFVLENPNDNFLLPSYFDTPPSTFVQNNTVNPMGMPPKNANISSGQMQAPTDVDILDEIFGSQNPNAPKSDAPKGSTQRTTLTYYPRTNVVSEGTNDQKVPMLVPLDPIPPVPEPDIQPPKKTSNSSLYATKLLAKETGKAANSIEIPQDVRLMFDPNATQLSANSIKWITAYALHIQKDPRLILSIRVSNQNWGIQQARLGIILRLLTEKGLAARQIRIFQSNRDPDSIILNSNLDPNQTKITVPEDRKQVIREQKTVEW